VGFIAAAQTKVQYATLIYFSSTKFIVTRSILHGIYDSILQWVYVDAWESNNSSNCIPEFREALVLSSSTPINHESLCNVSIIWRLLMGMIDDTKLPFPKAKKSSQQLYLIGVTQKAVLVRW